MSFTWLAAALLLAPAAGAETKKVSGAEQRKEVSITVYNGNFGLVREVRELELGSGRVSLEFRDVAANIQPETVSIKALGGGALDVLEQNYRYDLLSPGKLLEKHVGKKVRVHRWHEELGREDSYDAKILSVADGQPVLEINGEVVADFPGRISFSSVPENLMAKPTLVWLLESKAAKQKIEATYLTQNLNWKSDYVLVVNEDDSGGDLTGWVTLTNRSGASYQNAKLKLVAGDVQRVSGGEDYEGRLEERSYKKAEKEDRGFKEESFFEYHLYTLAQPTNVLDNEQKQVTLLEAKNAKLKKRLLYYGQQYWYRSQYGELQKNQKVGVYLELENSKKNGLGMPLPKGVVRVYKADKSGSKQFIGEDNIDHTPRDEKVKIKMGEAFDVVGDRKQMEWKAFGYCTSESTWEIELRNHKDQDVEVQVWEPVGGDWRVLDETHPHHKEDAFTFTFDVKVPKNGKTKIKYRVRVRWC